MRCLVLVLVLISTVRAAGPVREVFVDWHNLHKWDNSNGDTWDPFWADDDRLYSFNDDGRGFGRAARNLAFNRFTGASVGELAGSLVNAMDEYGKGGQKEKDNATWKACGAECIDSVFYCFVSRHVYGKESMDPEMRQTTFGASLIKSSDKGTTWTRSAAENYARPMWPGPRFSAPYFIHYGKNGGAIARDDTDKFVYAISPNGFWNNGDDFVLGRVPRGKLPDLNAADWSFYAAGEWLTEIGKARPILSLKSRCGMTGATWVPALKTYILIAWYNKSKLTKWYEPDRQVYEFYQAPHPWGPWTFISSVDDSHITGGHMYGPAICAKFQETIGLDVKVWMFTSGCPFEDKPTGLYKAWAIPLVLRTAPIGEATLINDDSPQIRYTGKWRAETGRKYDNLNRDVHWTRTPGDSAEMSFTGTGVELLSEKCSDLGNVDVYLDGQMQRNVCLKSVNFPRLTQVVVFAAWNLRDGKHTIRIVNTSSAYAVVDAMRVQR